MKKNCVVYTAILGEFDQLEDPRFVCAECDYVCFTDNPRLTSTIWEMRPLQITDSNPRHSARNVKILAHTYFDHEYSIWLDGNGTLLANPMDLIEMWLDETDLASFKHPRRNCLYEEALACIWMQKDDPRILFNQALTYMRAGYPPDNGLISTGLILRRNTCLIAETCESWWRELRQHSVRDQVSFNYAAWKSSLRYTTLTGSWGNNMYVGFADHLKGIAPRPNFSLGARSIYALALNAFLVQHRLKTKSSSSVQDPSVPRALNSVSGKGKEPVELPGRGVS